MRRRRNQDDFRFFETLSKSLVKHGLFDEDEIKGFLDQARSEDGTRAIHTVALERMIREANKRIDNRGTKQNWKDKGKNHGCGTP